MNYLNHLVELLNLTQFNVNSEIYASLLPDLYNQKAFWNKLTKEI